MEEPEEIFESVEISMTGSWGYQVLPVGPKEREKLKKKRPLGFTTWEPEDDRDHSA